MDMIKNELKSVKDELIAGFAEPLSDGLLYDFLINGSKYIRSTLAILYLKSLNIEITSDINKILAVGEIIHNASLLHDDVIDEAEIRRGKPTISEKVSPKISILSGDYLLSFAIEKLLLLKNFDILNIFKNCTKKMSETEIKQFYLRGSFPTETEYVDICFGKTAILFSSILESCALISKSDIKTAKTFAEIFGICFQIRNDLNEESVIADKKNEIYTAKDVLGIEKTKILLDNYKEEMRSLIKDFPQNKYKEELGVLINSL